MRIPFKIEDSLMSSKIVPGSRVIFNVPPLGVKNFIYEVLIIWNDLIPVDSVYLLIAPGSQFVAALGYEMSPLTEKGETL